MKHIALLIADDRPIIQKGLEQILSTDPSVSILQDVGSVSRILELAISARPAIMLLDLHYPEIGPYQLTMTTKELAGVKSVGFADPGQWSHVSRFMEAGGYGCLSKHSPASEILRAIKHVSEGVVYISPLLRRAAPTEQTSEVIPLSIREQEILELVALGYTGSEITQMLCISPKTVETHRARIAQKLNIKTRAELVRYAMEHGFLQPTRDPGIGD